MYPIPDMPTNVNPYNPYTGIDRGLFKTGWEDLQYARIQSAKWVCKGNSVCPGYLEFTVKAYATRPVTEAEYAGGQLLQAPDGTTTFNCITRGPVQVPIMAEYFAINAWKHHYATGGSMMAEDDFTRIDTMSSDIVSKLLFGHDVKSVQIEMSFEQPNAHGVIAGNQAVISYRAVKNGIEQSYDFNYTVEIGNSSLYAADPVSLAKRDFKSR